MNTALEARPSRRGRPPKPAQERRDYLVQAAFTKAEFDALVKYQALASQANEGAALRAAAIDTLRGHKLLKVPKIK